MKIGYYDEHEVFEESRDCIRSTFGLELSLIEQCRLREYVQPILKERSRINACINPLMAFDPVGEISTRFMIDYYGLPLDYAVAHTYWKKAPLLVHNKEGFENYLRILQERAHKP
jgi:hypothetical protein